MSRYYSRRVQVQPRIATCTAGCGQIVIRWPGQDLEQAAATHTTATGHETRIVNTRLTIITPKPAPVASAP